MEFVKYYGILLQIADDSLKKDYDIVLTAVKQNVLAIKFADNSLKKNYDIVLAAVKQHGLAIQFANKCARVVVQKPNVAFVTAEELDGYNME